MNYTKIIYKTADSGSVCLTVTVEVKEALEQSDRQIRSQRRQDKRHQTEFIDDLTAPDLIIPQLDITDLFDELERQKELYSALETLTEIQRRRTILHFYFKLSYRKIAVMEGVCDGSVAGSINQAIKKLKKLLSFE